MAKDIEYDILFLAYNDGNPAFVINTTDAKANNLNALKLRTDLSANQESYDAFVGMLDSHGIKDGNTVTLSRPFAQINVKNWLQWLSIPFYTLLCRRFDCLVQSSVIFLHRAKTTT